MRTKEEIVEKIKELEDHKQGVMDGLESIGLYSSLMDELYMTTARISDLKWVLNEEGA